MKPCFFTLLLKLPNGKTFSLRNVYSSQVVFLPTGEGYGDGRMPIVALIFTKFIKMGVEKVRKSRRFEGAPSSSVV